MKRKDLLLKRLDEIGGSLAKTGEALALLGLGSAGTQSDRMDAYSDLDFFAIVKVGKKSGFIDSLDWLQAVRPVVYAFKNTADGYKLLYEDGIFCEMAVFEPDELSHIPIAEGRLVWKAPGFDETICAPRAQVKTGQQHSIEWLLGEALTNLYVGLGRYWRGEKLSAARFIQGYAVDRIIDLAPYLETSQPAFADSFDGQRRFEQRFPNLACLLPEFIQGYQRSPESARALLDFLSSRFEVNAAIGQRIRDLCKGPLADMVQA